MKVNSKNYIGQDTQGTHIFQEIDTLFCDSSGMGGLGERALTKNQAISRVQAILDASDDTLYAGITGIGQFQVYVTLYRKAA